ncbi:hypothetical protein D3C71_624570 [compost metagenome]
MVPPLLAPATLTVEPEVGSAVALSLLVSVSTSRTVSVVGVPWKFAAGTKRSCASAASTRAVPSVRAPTGSQVVPLSSEYCQAPCAGSGTWPVIATPKKVSDELPPVPPLPLLSIRSAASSKCEPNRVPTGVPAALLPTSSVTFGSVWVVPPTTTGASLTGATVKTKVRVVTRRLPTPSA